MKSRQIVFCVLLLIACGAASAMNVNSRFRAISIERLQVAFRAFWDERKADPLMPTTDLTKGETRISSNEYGVTELEIGGVSFGFAEFARTGDIITVARYPSRDGKEDVTLRCVFTLTDEDVLKLKEFRTTRQKPHL